MALTEHKHYKGRTKKVVSSRLQPSKNFEAEINKELQLLFAILALKLRTGYTQDRPAQAVSFGYSQDNANH